MTCGSSPIVTTVVSISGSLRMRAAIDSMIVCVDCRLAPSGARTFTWNCDSSSTGRKFLLTALPRGTVDTNTSNATMPTTHRCAIDQSSIRMYVRSITA